MIVYGAVSAIWSADCLTSFKETRQVWPLYALGVLAAGFLWVSQQGVQNNVDTLFAPTPDQDMTIVGADGPDHGNPVSDELASSSYGRSQVLPTTDVSGAPSGYSDFDWTALQNSILSSATFSPVATPDSQASFASSPLGQLIHTITTAVDPVTSTPTPSTPAPSTPSSPSVFDWGGWYNLNI